MADFPEDAFVAGRKVLASGSIVSVGSELVQLFLPHDRLYQIILHFLVEPGTTARISGRNRSQTILSGAMTPGGERGFEIYCFNFTNIPGGHSTSNPFIVASHGQKNVNLEFHVQTIGADPNTCRRVTTYTFAYDRMEGA